MVEKEESLFAVDYNLPFHKHFVACRANYTSWDDKKEDHHYDYVLFQVHYDFLCDQCPLRAHCPGVYLGCNEQLFQARSPQRKAQGRKKKININNSRYRRQRLYITVLPQGLKRFSTQDTICS